MNYIVLEEVLIRFCCGHCSKCFTTSKSYLTNVKTLHCPFCKTEIITKRGRKSKSVNNSKDDIKRKRGRIFTKNNPFKFDPFLFWLKQFDALSIVWLEPFAGSNNLIKMLMDMDLCNKFASFDINPKNSEVKRRDTIKKFPKGYSVGVTNPPWLAKNSAKRRGLSIVDLGEYQDLYQLCIKKCLDNLDYLCAIIPESFITSGFFRDRLQRVVSINELMFEETDCPCCLAMWGKEKTDDFEVWIGSSLVGSYSKLTKHIPKSNFRGKIVFNNPDGILGLKAIDNTKKATISFIPGEEIPKEKIKVSSRSLTRISFQPSVDVDINELINLCNRELYLYRRRTHDIFLTSFKGLREDGRYRRRLDWKMAEVIIGKCLEAIGVKNGI
jgi:hypothetical protein